MKKMFLTLGAVLLAACGHQSHGASVATISAAGPHWQHVNMRSNDGHNINVDFVLTTTTDGSQQTTALDPLWVNVTNSNRPLTDADQIRVVLTPWTHGVAKGGNNPFGPSSQTVDLQLASGGRFTQQAPAVTVSKSNESGGQSWGVKVSVVVNGNWLVDQADQAKDFLFSPFF